MSFGGKCCSRPQGSRVNRAEKKEVDMGKEGRTQACQRERVRRGMGGALFLQSPTFQGAEIV